MRNRGRTGRGDNRMDVVYLGDSPGLHEICAWGQQHGIQPATRPTEHTLCAVVDPDLLPGSTTWPEHEVLRRVRNARLPYLTPEHAWPVLSSAVNRGLAPTRPGVAP